MNRSAPAVKTSALRWVAVGVFAVILYLGIWQAGVFYKKNLQGAGPALLPPKQDVAVLVDAHEAPLQVPPGFSLEIFAKGLTNPRVLVADTNGVVLVSETSKGDIVALPDTDGDGKAEPVTVLSGLRRPHGLAFRCKEGVCSLYVAETSVVKKYVYDPVTFKAKDPKVIAVLPTDGFHFTRSLLFLPPPQDDTLLMAVGSSCNVCVETEEWRAKVLVVNADGGEVKEYARGLRNTVFQAVNPATEEVWMTEMGRDFLGDDTPPDEINILKEGANYGWPNCYGQNIHDTDFDKNTYIRNPCQAPFETPSHIDLPAHSAPLGIAFVTGAGWPQEMQGNALVAFHGSWNRTMPTGYKIVRLVLDAKGVPTKSEDFLTGLLQKNGSALGRPVGLLVKPTGELFVSDDKAGVVYRVFRTTAGTALD